MIDLKKACLPESIKVDGRHFLIQTSFKYWLRFLELIENKNTPPQDFDFMYREPPPPSRMNGLMELIKFCNPTSVLPRVDPKEPKSEKAFDYEIDADYIFSAFMEQYEINLVQSSMHWYEFQALVKGLHETKFNEIINYRLWETQGKPDAYTRRMEELKRAWALPEESDENDEDLIAFEKIFNKD